VRCLDPIPTTVSFSAHAAQRTAGNQNDGEIGVPLVEFVCEAHHALVFQADAFDVGRVRQSLGSGKGTPHFCKVATDLHHDRWIVSAGTTQTARARPECPAPRSDVISRAIGSPAADQQPDIAATPGMTAVGIDSSSARADACTSQRKSGSLRTTPQRSFRPADAPRRRPPIYQRTPEWPNE